MNLEEVRIVSNIKKRQERMNTDGKSLESSFDKQVFVFDCDNPHLTKDGSESIFDCLIHLKKHEASPFDWDNPCYFDPSFVQGTGVFDHNNPDAMDTEFNSITQIGVFDCDNSHQPAFKRIGVFEQDNQEAKDTDPLNWMGNISSLWYTEKHENCVSVPFSLDLATQFTTPVLLTLDLEPNCSIYKLMIFTRRISQSFHFFLKNEEFLLFYSPTLMWNTYLCIWIYILFC